MQSAAAVDGADLRLAGFTAAAAAAAAAAAIVTRCRRGDNRRARPVLMIHLGEGAVADRPTDVVVPCPGPRPATPRHRNNALD